MASDTESINKRLDAIIYLLMKSTGQEKMTPVSEMIEEFKEMGLDLEVIKYFGESGRKVRWGHQ